MKLIFPNLQNDEGKTICQLFAVDYLKFLRERKVVIKNVDLNNMTSEIEGSIDLDKSFNDYLDLVFTEGLSYYHYTSKLIGRGKVDIAKKVSNPKKVSDFTKKIFEPSGTAAFGDMGERLFAGHIEALNEIRKDIKSNRCVQSEDEKGNVCNVCGLVEGKRELLTERISLVGDKCWKPQSISYNNLEACKRCGSILGLISNMRFLWRINVSGKGGNVRYSIVPMYKIDTTDPSIIYKITYYNTFFGLFRTKTSGTTSYDYLLNSLRSQPILAKIIADNEISLLVFIQSATGQGGFVTENVISPQKLRKLAEFTVFLNSYFPKLPSADGGSSFEISKLISKAAYTYATKGKNAAMLVFFEDVNSDFDTVKEILGGGRMKVEYFKDKEAIRSMDEYEWDNPLVRVSTFFVAERANQAKRNEKKPEQAINSPMALFNSIPEKDKTKIVRKYIDQITNGGKSTILNRIDRPEEFLSEFSRALNECSPEKLKEIARFMRIFANMYQYKKSEDKDTIVTDTLKELGYSLKPWEVKA
jgi:hypothetical protein